jgi:hypothetical protein
VLVAEKSRSAAKQKELTKERTRCGRVTALLLLIVPQCSRPVTGLMDSLTYRMTSWRTGPERDAGERAPGESLEYKPEQEGKPENLYGHDCYDREQFNAANSIC